MAFNFKAKMFSMLRSLLYFFCVTFFVSIQLKAQVFGGNNAKTKWQQINTDSFRIIFPKGIENSAQRIANVIYELQNKQVNSLGNQFNKIDVVLQNNTTFSNAYVALAPWRSEFYLTPPQNSFALGSIQWADNLAIHEWQHVHQYNNFNKGLAAFLGKILGQEGRAIANAASIPDWFFEGDAVFTETLLSNQGRGRLPEFFNGYKSILNSNLSNKIAYAKLRNGSLKNYVPNHYELGYLLVSYGKEKYGSKIWQEITQDAASFKPLFYPFQNALQKHIGISFSNFVKNAFSFYKEKWKENYIEPYAWLTEGNNKFKSDFKYPYLINDSIIIVLKRTYRDIPSLYKIDLKGNQEKIAVRNIGHDDYFSTNGAEVIYTSLRTNNRWGNEEFTDLNILNIQSKENKVIKTNLKLFSPDISKQSGNIIAVELNPNQQSNLVLLDNEGKVVRKIDGKDGEIFSYPKFLSNSNTLIVFFSRKRNGEMALIKYDFNDNKMDMLIPYANRIMGFPSIQHHKILMTVTNQQNDEIWQYDLNSKKVQKLMHYKTGLYQSVYISNNQKLITSAFTNLGQQLAIFSDKQFVNESIHVNKNTLNDLYLSTSLKQNTSFNLNEIPYRNFEVKKYSRLFKPFNFHSWRPYYDDPEFSFTIYGQNVLNTFKSELAYIYNRNESSHKVGYSGTYGGWFLQPYFGIHKTWDRSIFINKDTTLFWNEWNQHIGINLPLNVTSGKQYRFLNLSTAFYNEQVNWKGLGKNFLNDVRFNYVESRIQYSTQIQKAVQHIFPRWAQSISIQNRFIVNNYTAHQLLINGALYFPGFMKTHSLVLNASFQSRDTMNQYYFNNNFSFSRGYRSVNFPRMLKMSANYHLPLLYPDWGFANLIYFLRVRANIFYDFTQTKSLRTGKKFSFNTTGVELFFDTKWWNQQNISFGLRYSRLLNNEFSGATNPNQWEFIVPVNLFNN